jgi:ATP-binding cassette subfamily B protein
MSDFSNPLVAGVGGGGGGKAKKIDPMDRAQLAESPVSMRRVARLFRPHARTVTVVVALIVATSVISMGQPFLLRAVIDDALPHHDVRLLLLAVGGMLAVTVVSQLLGVVQTWLTTTVGQRVMHALRTDVFRHVQRQSIAFFTRTRSGEVQSRLTHDIAGMQTVITSSATGVASNLTTVVATAIAMVALSARLSLLSLLVIPPAVLMTRKVALVRRDITTLRQRRLADLHSQVEEGLTVSGVTLVKTLGAGEATADRFAATANDLIEHDLR